MTNKGKKLEAPFKLDVSFDEALSRFAAAKPKEVDDSIAKAKAKKPPRDDPPRRPERAKRQALKRP
ncbi:MAG: hypothetical protein ACREC4_00265 [Methylocella sp.]